MSRSSDIVYQIQNRRTERKKPKVNAKLKKVHIAENQKGGIAAAQENKPPPITVQKTGGRNSLALTFSIGLHVVIIIFMGILYIKDRIQAEPDLFAAAFVAEDTPNKRRTPPPPKKERFEVKQENIERVISRPPIATDANIPRTPGNLALPSTESAGDLIDPGLRAGPRAVDINRSIKGPVVPKDNPVITPKVERPDGQDTPLVDIDDVLSPSDTPGLDGFEIDTSQKGATPPKVLKKVKPTYPKNAKRAQKEAKVILVATIGLDGIAKNITASTKEGFGFEEAAIEALKKFKFIPGKKDGKPTELAIRIPFEFKLDDE